MTKVSFDKCCTCERWLVKSICFATSAYITVYIGSVSE